MDLSLYFVLKLHFQSGVLYPSSSLWLYSLLFFFFFLNIFIIDAVQINLKVSNNDISRSPHD